MTDENADHLPMSRASTDSTSLVVSPLFLERVLADASDAIVALDIEQRILLFNNAAEDIFGFTADEVLGRDLDVLLPDGVRRHHRAHVRGFLQGPVDRRTMGERGELVGRRKDGTEFPVEVTISKLTVEDQVVFTAIVRDISARRQLEERQRRDSQRLQAMFQHATDAVLVVDECHVVRFATPSFNALLGYDADRAGGQDGFAVVHPSDAEGYRRLFAFVTAAAGRSARYEFRAQHREGGFRWIEATVTNLLDEPHVAGVVINARDISARKAAEKALAHQAFHDELTGLPNRALLADRLIQALAAGARTGRGVGVFFIDLDRFKNVNDSLGHTAGDELLVAIAQRLGECTRPEDTVARIGGDEFVIIAPGAGTIERAVDVATRVASCFEPPVPLGGTSVFTSASIGIVLAERGDDPERVLADADIAMYRAKETGRGRYELFDETLRTRMRELLDLEKHLRAGIERHEFRTYYQPVVDLADESVQGVEALVRWAHPQRGLLSPDQFIPVAEESGLIVGIGRLVLLDACHAVVRHGRRGNPIDLAVNVSPRELDEATFIPQVASALEVSGLDPCRLVVEITESAAINDMEGLAKSLGQLKDMGVRVAMDDFGTGFSSLSHLSQLPVDIVKIDRSFVSMLDQGFAEAEIVGAICSLGRAMGLHVIAEGVETPAQRERLRELGCHSAQGYLFGRPRADL